MELDLRQLRLFVAVAEEAGLADAARRLRLSRPTLRARLRELEARLGVPLLEHAGGAITLTDAGRVLLERARPLLADAAAAVTAVQYAGALQRARLRVGSIAGAGDALFAPAVERFAERFPGVEVSLRRIDGVEALVRGAVDVALGPLPEEDGPLRVVPLLHGIALAWPHRAETALVRAFADGARVAACALRDRTPAELGAVG